MRHGRRKCDGRDERDGHLKCAREANGHETGVPSVRCHNRSWVALTKRTNARRRSFCSAGSAIACSSPRTLYKALKSSCPFNCRRTLEGMAAFCNSVPVHVPGGKRPMREGVSTINTSPIAKAIFPPSSFCMVALHFLKPGTSENFPMVSPATFLTSRWTDISFGLCEICGAGLYAGSLFWRKHTATAGRWEQLFAFE